MKRNALMSAVLMCSIFAIAFAAQPEYTTDGQLKRPADYREWIYLSSGVGMSYGANERPAPNPPFENIFVEPTAYRAFLKTGKWPEKAMFVMEARQAETKGSIVTGGHFQSKVNGLEVLVKDTKRFSDGGPATPTVAGPQVKDGWAFFGFDATAAAGKAFGAQGRCNACHNANAAVEHTFAQFYPTVLEVAKAKGTLKVSYMTAEAESAKGR